jgi:SPP1 family predicted phage head-tail adaptor
VLAQRLRHRIEIDELQIDRGPNGSQREVWIPFLVGEPAEIAPLSQRSREFVAANAIQGVVNTDIVIRWRPGLKPSMRCVHEGRIYDIKAVVPDIKLRQFATLLCEQGATLG